MIMNWQIEHPDMSGLVEIQETIKELRPDDRAALRDWLNGYEGCFDVLKSAGSGQGEAAPAKLT
jgi:hypothetical protein